MGALDGRTAIVTGGGRGIGAAIAVALDAAGARVALVARSTDQLEATASGLANDPVVIAADLGTAGGPVARWPPPWRPSAAAPTPLVNNAGIGVRKDSETLTVDELDLVWNVNVRSALLATAAVIPAMLAAGSGSIVSISSISGRRGKPLAVYAASKAALDGMTRSLAMEYGPRVSAPIAWRPASWRRRCGGPTSPGRA